MPWQPCSSGGAALSIASAASHASPRSSFSLLSSRFLPRDRSNGSIIISSTRRKRPQRPCRLSDTTPSSRVPASRSASSRRTMCWDSAQKRPAWLAHDTPSKRFKKRLRPPFFIAALSSSATSCSSSSRFASAAKARQPPPPGQPPFGSSAWVSWRTSSVNTHPKAFGPYGPLMRSILPKPKASPEVPPSPACRSPRVIAPSCRRRRVTAETKRASPPRSLTRHVKAGGCIWLDRWTRPSCCTALSAAQGNSRLSIRLGRGAAPPATSRRSLCSEMPADAASVMMATIFCPLWNARFSATFTESTTASSPEAPAPAPPLSLCRAERLRGCDLTSPVAGSRTWRWARPDISATASGPPSRSVSSSMGLGGSCRLRTRALKPLIASTAHVIGDPDGSAVGKCLSKNCSTVSSGPDAKPSTAWPPPTLASSPSPP
mmetsp:Transcript_43963/g.133152  ORF Transcript_43963/g.133152 Transcript_43963/m.133152 type:complete len:432 (+) Transcript_43963:633-1928(+)